ncbi:MAG: tyrosine-protein phosphatase [Clostridia bacterium]|nr:tyrosine-protein phosphatase [Clostridia bacterium]
MANTKFTNFRDMGGIATPCGKIKCGKLFRTGAFVPKCKADEEYIKSMRLDAVVDFRTPAEVEDKPDQLPLGVEYVRATVFEVDAPGISTTSGTIKDVFKMSETDVETARKFVEEKYAEMAYSKEYDKLFALMDEGKTIAFHCTAGKDRTGIAAMLIELAFGRTFEECKAEYLASNEHRAEENKKIDVYLKMLFVKRHVREFVAEVLRTHEHLFEIAKKSIFDKYATVDEFLEAEHGITKERVERWKQFYIEK